MWLPGGAGRRREKAGAPCRGNRLVPARFEGRQRGPLVSESPIAGQHTCGNIKAGAGFCDPGNRSAKGNNAARHTPSQCLRSGRTLEVAVQPRRRPPGARAAAAGKAARSGRWRAHLPRAASYGGPGKYVSLEMPDLK